METTSSPKRIKLRKSVPRCTWWKLSSHILQCWGQSDVCCILILVSDKIYLPEDICREMLNCWYFSVHIIIQKIKVENKKKMLLKPVFFFVLFFIISSTCAFTSIPITPSCILFFSNGTRQVIIYQAMFNNCILQYLFVFL